LVHVEMKTRTATVGAAFICLSAALWGLDGVVLTPRLANLQVPFVVFLLHAVPFALMQPFLWRSYRRLRSMSARGWLALALVAFTGGLLGTVAIVKALFLVDFNQLSVVVLLQKLQPLFALALAAILLGERVSARFLAAAVVALGGAYLLTFGLSTPDATADGISLQAALLAILAALSALRRSWARCCWAPSTSKMRPSPATA
jgi:drug/metabolite transporter (DMT)-like permease